MVASGQFAHTLKDAVSGERVSRAFTGSLILGNASPSISLSSTRASTPSSTSSRVSTPLSVASHSIADVERCSCCNIDDFWKIYNSFCLMDKRGCKSVQRCDFYEATTEHVTLEMRRTITRGDLHARFRTSSKELSFEELLDRIWPSATDADKKMMNQWTNLHDASSYLSTDSFQGTHRDLKQIFDLLDMDGSQTLSMSEMVRARILTKDEARDLLKNWNKEFGGGSDDLETHLANRKKSGFNTDKSLSFSDFCLLMQKPLTDKYAQKGEEDSAKDTWDVHCRQAFAASKKKVSVKTVCSTIKTINALGGFRRSEKKNPLTPRTAAKAA